MAVTILNGGGDITKVPVERKINGKTLESDIALNASDVGALSSDYQPTYYVNYTVNGTTGTADKNPLDILVEYHSGKAVYLNFNYQGFPVSIPLVTATFMGEDIENEVLLLVFSGSANFNSNIIIATINYGVTQTNEWYTDIRTSVDTRTTINGQGLSDDINLTATDVGALPSTTTIPSKTSQLTNDSNYITASGAPVQSVNGKTGAVTLAASDVGALPISGGTLTGNLTGQYITGTWLQATTANHLSGAATKIAVQDSSGWIYHRTAEEIRSDIGAGTSNFSGSYNDLTNKPTLNVTCDDSGNVTLSLGGVS